MMNVGNKGQAALEYLLTYGWAILIIIIVGASLYALGIFNPGSFTGQRDTGFTQVKMTDFRLDTDVNLSLYFGNSLGKTVTLGNVTAIYKNKECSSDELSASDRKTFGPNKDVNITLSCSDAWSISELAERTSYSITIEIGYTDPDSSYEHTALGTIFGSVEKVTD